MTEHGGAAALKQNNLAALRSALYHTDFATKKELAEQCRLSLAACTALLGEMIDDGQVLELAFAASNGGRPARRFSINPNYAHILCLYTANNDVERSGIALRVCDLKGNSLQENSARSTTFCRRTSRCSSHRWCRQIRSSAQSASAFPASPTAKAPLNPLRSRR